MMEKIKTFLSSLVGTLILVLSAAVGILLWMLSNKRKEVLELKAQIDLAQTQREVDLVEVQIKERLQNKNLLAKEIKELENALDQVENRRKEIFNKESNKTSDEIENYWRNS